MAMARRLVTGVDVWLNTPEYPLEASGTSGQKAGLNGVVNLSVLDGWWGEGYDGNNGWSISPHPASSSEDRDRLESQTILDVLEHHVIQTYFRKDEMGYSADWIRLSKASMKTILPKYNAQRMVKDYINHYYTPAIRQGKRIERDDHKPAIELATWKRKVHEYWPNTKVRRIDDPVSEIESGDTLPILVGVQLEGLEAEDIVVECLIGRATNSNLLDVEDVIALSPQEKFDSGEILFRLDLTPRLAGLQYYQLRAYPFHHLLTHRFELGYMVWI
jgi:starch phosphorylase